MKKINAKKYIYIIVVIILVIGITIPVILWCNSQKEKNTKVSLDSVDVEIVNILSEIYYSSSMYLSYSENFYEAIEKNQEKIDELETTMPYLYYYICGILESSKCEYDLAFDHFEKCVSYYDPNLNYDETTARIFGRAYYEMAYAEAKNDCTLEYKNYIAKMEEVLLEKKCYKALVDMLTWVCSESYSGENGVGLSITYAEKMVEYARKYNYPDLGFVYIVASNAYGTNNNDVMFINYAMLAMDEYSHMKDDLGNEYVDNYEVAYCLVNIGNQYLNEENYDTAEKYIMQAFEMDLSDYDIEIQAEIKVYAAQNLCYLANAKKDFDQAKAYLECAKEWIPKESEDVVKTDNIAIILTEAECELAKENYDNAILLLDECLKQYNAFSKFNYINFDCDIYTDLAEAYYKKGDYETALEYYKTLENVIRYRGLDSESEKYLKGLFLTYLALDDEKTALEYAEKYQNLLKEKIKNSQSIQGAYLEYLNSEQENQIQVLSGRNRRMLVMNLTGGLIIFIIVCLGIVIVRQSRRLKEISEIDELTKINNRRSMDIFLENQWPYICNTSQSVCVAMADIDFFKNYNDTYGHQMGDEVLTKVAKVFKEVCTKDNSFIARYGGEEFIIVIWNLTNTQAIEQLEKIRSKVQNLMIEHSGSEVLNTVTISIGCYLYDENSEDISYEKAISFADKALYKAKEEKNKVEVY